MADIPTESVEIDGMTIPVSVIVRIDQPIAEGLGRAQRGYIRMMPLATRIELTSGEVIWSPPDGDKAWWSDDVKRTKCPHCGK